MKHKKKSFKGFSSIVFYTENDVEIELKASDIIGITRKINATKIGKRKYETSERFVVVIRAKGDGFIEGYEPDTKFQRLLDVSDVDVVIFKYKGKENYLLYVPYVSTDDIINQSEVVKRLDDGSLVVIFTEWEYINSLTDEDINSIIMEVLK
jgi:hypothetical protein